MGVAEHRAQDVHVLHHVPGPDVGQHVDPGALRAASSTISCVFGLGLRHPGRRGVRDVLQPQRLALLRRSGSRSSACSPPTPRGSKPIRSKRFATSVCSRLGAKIVASASRPDEPGSTRVGQQRPDPGGRVGRPLAHHRDLRGSAARLGVASAAPRGSRTPAPGPRTPRRFPRRSRRSGTAPTSAAGCRRAAVRRSAPRWRRAAGRSGAVVHPATPSEQGDRTRDDRGRSRPGPRAGREASTRRRACQPGRWAMMGSCRSSGSRSARSTLGLATSPATPSSCCGPAGAPWKRARTCWCSPRWC